MKIPSLTFGTGDRFGLQGEAQLAAIKAANTRGVPLHPVWNKSNREHTIIGTEPRSLREEADRAVRNLGWDAPYFVDADHINLGSVDRFVDSSDFFTIDVADFTGKRASEESIREFVASHQTLIGRHHLPGLDGTMEILPSHLDSTAAKFLLAIQEAGKVYRHIAQIKGEGNFVVEISVDETDTPQTPPELLLILAMIAGEKIPVQTIAPKFTGRFNKGVDYVGDIATFTGEFDADLAVLAYAVKEFGLPETLKISVHSGSDKFSLYPIIRRLIQKHGAGLHLKTAGTTWLEEVAGLAEAGGENLRMVQEIYKTAFSKADDLIQPYAQVVDIPLASLPTPAVVSGWTSEEFLARLDHDPANPLFHSAFRQFFHVSFKIAALRKAEFTDAVLASREVVSRRVTDNLFKRHIEPLFC